MWLNGSLQSEALKGFYFVQLVEEDSHVHWIFAVEC